MFSSLNFFDFSPSETKISTIVGIIDTYATVGIATWADTIGTNLLELESTSFQNCRKCANFMFLKPILRIIENNI